MFIIESVVAGSLICASTKRPQVESALDQMCIVGRTVSIQRASGRTLESVMTNEIQNMSGVANVTVKRTGSTFDVLVVMENTDFEPFNQVAQRKVNLYEEFPDYTFTFEFITVASLHQQQSDMLAYHAA